MNKLTMGLITAGSVIALTAIVSVVNYSSAVAYGARSEASIQATYLNNENIYSKYTRKIAEEAQVPAMATAQLKSVITTALQARYGNAGSQAVFQFIKESYPGTVDPQLYRTLQEDIGAGRDEFAQNQTVLLDKKRVYQQSLSYVWKGFWLKMAGYPKMDLSKYKVITDTQAQQAFTTGTDAGVSLSTN